MDKILSDILDENYGDSLLESTEDVRSTADKIMHKLKNAIHKKDDINVEVSYGKGFYCACISFDSAKFLSEDPELLVRLIMDSQEPAIKCHFPEFQYTVNTDKEKISNFREKVKHYSINIKTYIKNNFDINNKPSEKKLDDFVDKIKKAYSAMLHFKTCINKQISNYNERRKEIYKSFLEVDDTPKKPYF